jgi:hypothetical protein
MHQRGLHVCVAVGMKRLFLRRLRITSKSGSSFWPAAACKFGFRACRSSGRFPRAPLTSTGPVTTYCTTFHNDNDTPTSFSPDVLLLKAAPAHHGSIVRAARASSRADFGLSACQVSPSYQQCSSNGLSEPAQHPVALRSHLNRTGLAPL